jgi:hypothetical protein
MPRPSTPKKKIGIAGTDDGDRVRATPPMMATAARSR